MKQPRSNSWLAGLVLLVTVAHLANCRLFFNRGLLFPCVFFEPQTGKLLMLYGLQQVKDFRKNFSVPSIKPGEPASQYEVTGNFCKMTNNDLDNVNTESIGAMLIRKLDSEDPYALSYSNGYLDSTQWSIKYEGDDENSQSIIIKGTSGKKANRRIADPTFRIYCDKAVTTSQGFIDSFKLVSVTADPKGEGNSQVVFEGKYSLACGWDAKFLSEADARFLMVVYVVLGLLLLMLGYSVLRWTLTISLFVLGCLLTASEIFDNTTISMWGKLSWTIFMLIIFGLGAVLSYSAFYFPTGAIYLGSIFLGHILAQIISDYFEIAKHLYVAHILLHAAFLLASIAVFKNNLNNCKFAFTALLGGWLLLMVYTNVRYNGAGLYLDSLLRPTEAFRQFPVSAVLACLVAFCGFLFQRRVYKSQTERDGPNAEVDEFMEQQ